jgi:uncharacterized protein (DUF58 family)
LKAGDNVGYGLFNNKIVDFMPPKKGMGTHVQLLDTLSQANIYGGGYNIKHALDFVMENLAEGTIVFIISDFIGLEPGWIEAVRMAETKFSMIGIMVVDPIDRRIPEGMGQIAIGNPLTEDNMLIDPKLIGPFYEQETRRIEEHVRSTFFNEGSDFVLLQTNEDFIGKMIELFRMRQAKYE